MTESGQRRRSSRTSWIETFPARVTRATRHRENSPSDVFAHAPRDQEVSKVRAAHQGAASPEVRENSRRPEDEVRGNSRANSIPDEVWEGFPSSSATVAAFPAEECRQCRLRIHLRLRSRRTAATGQVKSRSSSDSGTAGEEAAFPQAG